MDDRSSNRPVRSAPHLPDTEAGVLAACLTNPSWWALATSIADDAPSLFYDPDHQAIADAFTRLSESRHVINESSVADTLRVMGVTLADGEDQRHFLASLTLRASARTQEEFRDQITALVTQRNLRNIIRGALDLAERAAEPEATPQALMERIQSIAANSVGAAEPLKFIGEYVDDFDYGQGRDCISTPLKALDNIIQGWQGGRMYALAARPKIGKTAFALNAAIKALSEGAMVVYVSLEMERKELWDRIVAATANVPYRTVQDIHTGQMEADELPEGQREAFLTAEEQLRRCPLAVMDQTDVRSGFPDVVGHIHSLYSRRAEGQKMLVVIDYLQLLVRDAEKALHEVTNYSRELKLLAGRLDVPILVLSQINRSGDDGEMPHPSQMRGSGSIEQDADATILFNRKGAYNEDHPKEDMDIHVALSRYSTTGWAKAYFSGAEQTITDYLDSDLGIDDDGPRRSERSTDRPRYGDPVAELLSAADDMGLEMV